MEEIRGTVTRIFFHNEENGFTIAEMENEDMEVTIVGGMAQARPGATYLLRGEFRVHPKYGEEFSFSYAEETLPTSEAGIRDFLSSGSIKGVGPKTAQAIVKKFGKDTLKILEESPARLKEVDGIGEAKADKIAESFAIHREFADVALKFSEFGITASQALKLYKAYGRDSVAVIKENPYRLIDEVSGIGFRKADKIAGAMGVAQDDPIRVESGIKAYLSSVAGDGSTYMPKVELLETVADFLDVTRENVSEGLAALCFDGSLMTCRLGDTDAVYLYPYYAAEKSVVGNMADIMAGELKPLAADLKSSLRSTEGENGIELSQGQKEAVVHSVDSPVSVITGGPGTGKTTIIKALIDIFESSGFTVALAAPTGRAAKRMEQTTGHFAQTVHRLLEYHRDDDSGEMIFGKDKDEPLEYDVLIIDESSMIDLMLMKGVTEAVKPGTRLILVGDSDQLPSVGPGNVLRDIIESGIVKTEKLTEIFRQAEESMIVVNAHRINQGEYPALNIKDKDFFFMKRDLEQDMLDLIVELVTKRLPSFYNDLDPLYDIQVLTPTHKGMIGTDSLNKALQEAINPGRPDLPEKSFGGSIFRKGDKVMQIKNDYDIEWRRPGEDTNKGVFNGDVGVISDIDPEEGVMTVVYDDDRYADYDFTMLDELELAYAMTVHKSQGNEFPVIVMPVAKFPPMLATRNLLYTAITRGKSAVVTVGSREWMNAMVDNNRISKRYSGLEQRLSDFRAITGE